MRLRSANLSAWTIASARSLILFGGICFFVIGCASPVIQGPPPPAPPPAAPYNGPTLCNVLGVPDSIAAAKACCIKINTCCKRQFPGPGDPPNLTVDAKSSPAVKCAAEIIAAEAEAPQKIDALRYLGRVGCTKCYPCVETSLIAALDDCTESVRFEAAKAIRATLSEPCKCCNCTSCCTPKIHEKLYKVAFGTDADGCPTECSSRVRRVARQALELCSCPSETVEDTQEPTPEEGPNGKSANPPSAANPSQKNPPSAPTSDKTADSTGTGNVKPEAIASPGQSEKTKAAQLHKRQSMAYQQVRRKRARIRTTRRTAIKIKPNWRKRKSLIPMAVQLAEKNLRLVKRTFCEFVKAPNPDTSTGTRSTPVRRCCNKRSHNCGGVLSTFPCRN